eukprot:jgi/Psemu1/321812/estExt_fgenesh1_pg.C_110016
MPDWTQSISGGRSTYALDEDEDLFVQSFPPLSSFIRSDQVPTSALLEMDREKGLMSSALIQTHGPNRTDDDDLYYSGDEEEEEENDNDGVYYRGDDDASASNENNHSDVALLFRSPVKSTPRSRSAWQRALSAASPPPNELQQRRETERRIQRNIEAERRKIDEECRRTAEILGEIVLECNREAETIRKQQRAEEDRRKAEEDRIRKAREEEEDRVRKQTERAAAALKQKTEQAEAAQKEKTEQQEAVQKEREARAAKLEQKRVQDRAEAAKATEYIDRAKKLVAQLVQLRSSVEPFEKNKAVGKRRLGMKKMANGKVNTLNDSGPKIREVAAEMSNAIAKYDQEDAQLKQQLQQGTPGVTADMAVGRRYFVDLLASTAMKRVQAESFGGTKGDGFPLAMMLAMVAVEGKQIIPVLAAHIYTVCPTAIPTLPAPKADASEDDVMTGLGMQRDKKTGEFESFPQFLARTENIVSFVAAIQSSLPSSHQLMGGNTGAIKWLKRFLDLLPPAPTSPLPLITAPVLGAFLTGAGHMLANVHSEDFRKLLTVIQTDIVNRLDEGEIGKPSAIRLGKVLEGGFDSFAKNLPPKAIPELYYGASEHSQKKEGVISFGGTIGGEEQIVQPKKPQLMQQPQNPFGGGGSSFGGSGSNNNSNSNPFGGGGGGGGGFGTGNQQPFGSSAPAPAPNPFGGGAAPAPSPFGGGGGGGMASSPSPFGGAPAPSASPFGGGAAPSPSPFGGGAAPSPSPLLEEVARMPTLLHLVEGGMAPSPSPFGGGGMAPSPSPCGWGFGTIPVSVWRRCSTISSPFGGGNTSANPSPFGGGGMAPSPSPFGGGGMAPSPSPFGAGGMAPSPSPFGGASAPSPSPFGGNASSSSFGGGGNQMQQSSPFGGGGNGKKKGPCRFFAQGKCNRGNSCPYSHESGGGNSGFGGGFQSNQNNKSNTNNRQGGGKKGPCRFFAQGRCKKGNDCPFSHDAGGGGGNGGFGGGFQSNNWNSFGGPRR